MFCFLLIFVLCPSHSAAELRAKSAKLGYLKSGESVESYKPRPPPSCRYSRLPDPAEPPACRWMGVNSAQSTPSLIHNFDDGRVEAKELPSRLWPPPPSNCLSTPNLDQEAHNHRMGIRKFKKASVYEALASKSGLDFAPMIQQVICHFFSISLLVDLPTSEINGVDSTHPSSVCC